MLLRYILKRILLMIPTLLVTSALIFTVINLPEGDYFETLAAEMQAQGEKADMSRIEFLKQEYGFDKPPLERYVRWVAGLLQGDMGYSFEYQRPVREIVGDRLLLTMMVSFATIIFTWIVAFPIGIYSATHQYSWGDYGLTFLGLVGLAVPHFLLALVFMYFANIWFGTSIGHLMDQQAYRSVWLALGQDGGLMAVRDTVVPDQRMLSLALYEVLIAASVTDHTNIVRYAGAAIDEATASAQIAYEYVSLDTAPLPAIDALVRNEGIVGLHCQRVLDGHEVQRTAFSLEDQVGPVAGAEEVCGARVGFAPGGRVPAGAVQRHGQMKRIGHTTTLPSRAQIAAAAAPSASGEGIVGRLCGRSGPAHMRRRHCRPCHQTDQIAAGT